MELYSSLEGGGGTLPFPSRDAPGFVSIRSRLFIPFSIRAGQGQAVFCILLWVGIKAVIGIW